MEAFAVGPVHDGRFDEVRHLDMVYSFKAPETPEEWAQRAAYLRAQILTGTGLMPMPEKTPLNARIFGRIEHDDYTVEKVFFESFPGFYVTGNLYRPRGKTGPFPAVLNPHGHAPEGRLEDNERSSGPRRAIGFAKHGYVAFAYDMIGYVDSFQLKHREDLIGERFRLWGISMGGLQLWNSIRAVDFLLSLPEVDPERIACTGASGGGTQTFMLTAVDDRVKYAAPVVMLSSTMQGGCVCENPPLVRLDTNNMEIGALAAPRPLMLVAATGDWTKLTPTVEFPAVKSVYDLLGVPEKVGHAIFEAEHNYNRDSRETVFAWFGRWILGNPDAGAFKEQPIQADKPEQVRVFGKPPVGEAISTWVKDRVTRKSNASKAAEQPMYMDQPGDALDPEGIVRSRIEASEKQFAAMKPPDAESLYAFRDVYGEALRHALAIEMPLGYQLTVEKRGTSTVGGTEITKLAIGRKGKGDAIPALLMRREGDKERSAVLAVHSQGKAALFENGKPSLLIQGLLDGGHAVLAIDCFGVGEHAGPQDRTSKYQFFDTYNRTDTMERVQDILTAVAYFDIDRGSFLSLMGMGDAGLWCLLAMPFAGPLHSAVIDAAGFDTSSDEEFVERLYVPCLRRVGDVRTAGALCNAAKLMIHNTRGRFDTDFIRDAGKASRYPGWLSEKQMPATDEAIYRWMERD